MNQIKVIIDPSLGLETRKMIEIYFLVKTVSHIEGFVHSEEEFLNRYKNTYSFNDLKTANFFAIYRIERCANCKSSYDIILRDRSEIHDYLMKSNKICIGCEIFQSSTENMLGLNF